MVQYYRAMWVKHSEMLAPFSDVVGECGETKTTHKNKVKKTPWHWDSIHQIAFDNVKKTITKSYPSLRLGHLWYRANRTGVFISKKITNLVLFCFSSSLVDDKR